MFYLRSQQCLKKDRSFVIFVHLALESLSQPHPVGRWSSAASLHILAKAMMWILCITLMGFCLLFTVPVRGHWGWLCFILFMRSSEAVTRVNDWAPTNRNSGHQGMERRWGVWGGCMDLGTSRHQRVRGWDGLCKVNCAAHLDFGGWEHTGFHTFKFYMKR